LPFVVTTVPGLVPAVLFPDAVMVASPCAKHGELNVTVTELAVYKVPVSSTMVALRLAVPPAESGVVGVTPMTPLVKPLPLPLPNL
jgi:hypothetical protein